jgi:serpin B
MRHFLAAALVLALPVLGCNGSQDAPTGTVVQASVPRDTAPQVASGDEATLVAGNTDFAFGLYQGLSTGAPSGNLFYSPYSVSLALAMTYAGAAGNTATQMATAMGFTLPAARLHPTFDALDLAIQAKPAGATGADGAPFALTLADALWGDQTVSFAPTFVDALSADYGANLRTVDFAGASTAAEAQINNWVAAETNDKIDPFLSPGELTPETRFVIVNAVYFNASWATAFDPSATKTGAFTRADGSTVQAPIMSSAAAATRYAQGSNWQAVELPYSGNKTSMVIVLPDPGAYAAVEQGLGADFFQSVTSALSPSQAVALTMPKFKIHGATVSLVPALQARGMVDAFDPAAANFSAMIPAGGVYIGDVVHQAFVDVDESGTEAAAATGVIGVGLAFQQTVTVNVDHAFFFFVRDVATNTVLFAGRESDPTAQ